MMAMQLTINIAPLAVPETPVAIRPCLPKLCLPFTKPKSRKITMHPRQLGDVTIHRILELEEPFVDPKLIFDDATDAKIDPYRIGSNPMLCVLTPAKSSCPCNPT